MGENMAEETEKEATVSKSRKNASQKDPEFIARHNANQRRWANELKTQTAERIAQAIDNGEDVWLTSTKRTNSDQCIRASEIKEWGLLNTPELRPAKKGEPGYYADKIL